MKRDLDLIRDMLLHIEDVTSFNKHIFSSTLDLDTSASQDDVYGHIALLLDEEFIVGDLEEYMGTEMAHINIERLTNKGHDYLDSIRSPKIWKKTKEGLTKVGGSTTLAVVQALAVSVSYKMLGLT